MDNWYKKGIDLYNRGKYEEAIEAYDQALKINSRDVKILFNKGLVLMVLHKYHEAIEIYDLIIKFEPKHSEAKQKLTLARKKLGRKRINHENSKSQNIQINTPKFIDNKDNDLSNLAKYASILKKDSNSPGIWFGMGLTLKRLGMYSEAIEAFDHALQINPGFYAAQKNREFILKHLMSAKSDK